MGANWGGGMKKVWKSALRIARSGLVSVAQTLPSAGRNQGSAASRRATLAAFLVAVAFVANGAERSGKVVAEFKREQPCPATGQRRGACPGYVVDHIALLCEGGPDALVNLQWQTVADAKAKGRDEWRLCRIN